MILVLGSTGMLGQALCREAKKRKLKFATLARQNADFSLDITNEQALQNLDLSPYSAIINTAAIANIDQCEQAPALAALTNTKPLGILAEKTMISGAYLIQISTDHFFSGDGSAKHDEKSPIKLLNEYAKSKFAGEKLALANPNALVIRTNIVGWRGQATPTFVEHMLARLQKGDTITAFTDVFASSIDVNTLAQIIFDLISMPKNTRPIGILNIASSEVVSKKEFIEAMAHKWAITEAKILPGSVKNNLNVPRAESLGLDVGKAEKILGYSLPKLDKVMDALWLSSQERMKCSTTAK